MAAPGFSASIPYNLPKPGNKIIYLVCLSQFTEATCPDLGEKPENSEIECTGSSSRTIGTKCTYTCDPGYKLVGFGRITCVSRSDGSANGDWSAPPPICERKHMIMSLKNVTRFDRLVIN